MNYELNEINQAIYEKYERFCHEFYSANTYRSYLKGFMMVAKWVEEKLGKQLLQLTKEEAKAFLDELTFAKNEKGEWRLKTNTLERRRSAFTSIYNYLETEYHIENPFLDLVIEREDEEKPKEEVLYLTDAQINDLLLALKTHSQNDFLAKRDVFMTRLVISTGITIEELIDLKLHQLDFTNEQLTLADRRVLPLSKKLEAGYREYLALREAYALKNPTNQDHVFISLRGGLLSSQNNNATLRKAGKIAEIPFMVSTSVLRHTYAVRQLKGHVPVETVSKRLGHQRLYYTMRTYAPFITEAQHQDLAI